MPTSLPKPPPRTRPSHFLASLYRQPRQPPRKRPFFSDFTFDSCLAPMSSAPHTFHIVPEKPHDLKKMSDNIHNDTTMRDLDADFAAFKTLLEENGKGIESSDDPILFSPAPATASGSSGAQTFAQLFNSPELDAFLSPAFSSADPSPEFSPALSDFSPSWPSTSPDAWATMTPNLLDASPALFPIDAADEMLTGIPLFGKPAGGAIAYVDPEAGISKIPSDEVYAGFTSLFADLSSTKKAAERASDALRRSPVASAVDSTPALSPTQLTSPSPEFAVPDLPASRPASAAVGIAKPPSVSSASGRIRPTGTRRSSTPALSHDAPIQPRNYATPSATSRKVVPAAFEAKLRNSPNMNGKRDAETAELPEEVAEAIEAKRRMNTLAARKSRERKREHLQNLESLVEELRRERDEWRERAERAEAALAASAR